MSTHIVTANLAGVTELGEHTRHDLWNASGKVTAQMLNAPVTAADVRTANVTDATAMVKACRDPAVLHAVAQRERRIKVLNALGYNPHQNAECAMVLLEAFHGTDTKVTLEMVAAAGITRVFTSPHAPEAGRVSDFTRDGWLDTFSAAELGHIASYPAGDALVSDFIWGKRSALLGVEVFNAATPGGMTRRQIAATLIHQGPLTDEWVNLLATDEVALTWGLVHADAPLRVEHPESLKVWVPTQVDPVALLSALAEASVAYHDMSRGVPSELIENAFSRVTRWDRKVSDSASRWLVTRCSSGNIDVLAAAIIDSDVLDRWRTGHPTLLKLVTGLLTNYELTDDVVRGLLVACGEWSAACEWFAGTLTKNQPDAATVAAFLDATDPDECCYGALLAHPHLWSAGIVDRMFDDDAVCEHLLKLGASPTPEVVRHAIAAAFTPYTHKVVGKSPASLVAAHVCRDDVANLASHDVVWLARTLLRELELEPRVAAHVAARAGGNTVLGVLNGEYPANPAVEKLIVAFAEDANSSAVSSEAISRIVGDVTLSDTARQAHVHNAELGVATAMLNTVAVPAAVLAATFSSEGSGCATQLTEAFISGGFTKNPPTDGTVAAVLEELDLDAHLRVLVTMASVDTPMSAPVRAWLTHTDGLARMWADTIQCEAFTRNVIDVLGVDINTASTPTWLVIAEAADGFTGTFGELADLVETLTT